MPRRAASASSQPKSKPGAPDRARKAGRTVDDVLPSPTPPPVPVLTEEEFHPVSRVKVMPYPHREATLSRERLLDFLREGCKRRVSLIVAEAGYGKSTLLADFARQDEIRCLWYKLDSTDGDWVTFLNYLIASAREAWPEFGVHTAALLSQMAIRNPSRDLVVSTFFAELSNASAEPILWIFDDFHEVDESEDARDLVGRMVREAPDTVHICIVTRRKPDLPLGRLRAQGEVGELTTDDMRFSLDETGQLFGEVYGQPLESDVLAQVEGRTKGWAASLQLLNSSIRGRSRTEVRSFVRTMTGAEGPLYDFLAEEVIGDLDPELRNFLLHASMLELIKPEYVAAAMERDGAGPAEAQVIAWIGESMDLGLLGRSDASRVDVNLHPLLREFLARELVDLTSESELRGIHARIGREASLEDWLTAALHLELAGEREEAALAIERAAKLVIGTGQSRQAAQLLTGLDVPTGPAASALLVRQALEEGRTSHAESLLANIDIANCSPDVRAILRQSQAKVAWTKGDERMLTSALAEWARDSELPPAVRRLGEVWNVLVSSDFECVGASAALQTLAKDQTREGLHYYAGISLLNSALLLLNAGSYHAALDTGADAVRAFNQLPVLRGEQRSAFSVLATAEFELGRVDEGHELMAKAIAPGPMEVDALLESGLNLLFFGDHERASELIRRANALGERQHITAGDVALAALANTRLAITLGQPFDAGDFSAARPPGRFDFTADAAFYLERSYAAYLVDDREDAIRSAQVGLRQAVKQGSIRWVPRLELVAAAAARRPSAFAHAVEATAASGELGLLQTAEAVVAEIHILDVVPDSVRGSIQRWPLRWLPLLRRAVLARSGAQALSAARLLDDFGTLEDVPLLRALDRQYPRGRRLGLGRGLARRESPRLELYDLGRTRIKRGESVSSATTIRRKAASLLLYLASRGGSATHREQLLEDLWPEGDPTASMNNLNQTLYFLRRDIDRWYEDGVTAEYVRFEGDLLWLDPDMVWVASHTFDRQTPRGPIGPGDVDAAARAFGLYEGRFAPEFEYEDWSAGWREHLHARFLRLAQSLVARLTAEGELTRAEAVADAALRRDPGALDLERDLIWLYAESGSRAAALEQYRHFATTTRGQLGLEPPSLEEILAAPPGQLP